MFLILVKPKLFQYMSDFSVSPTITNSLCKDFRALMKMISSLLSDFKEYLYSHTQTVPEPWQNLMELLATATKVIIADLIK